MHTGTVANRKALAAEKGRLDAEIRAAALREMHPHVPPRWHLAWRRRVSPAAEAYGRHLTKKA